MTNIILRIPDPLHDLARLAATPRGRSQKTMIAGTARRRSLNAWICDAIQAAVLREIHRDPSGPVAAAAKQLAGKH